MYLIHNFYSVDETGVLIESQLAGSGKGSSKQTFLPMYFAAPTPLMMAIAVHPIKTPGEFFKFVAQVSGRLRPSLPSTKFLKAPRSSKRSKRHEKKQLGFKKKYLALLEKSCVANIAEQICRWHDALPTCIYVPASGKDYPLEEVFVPTFHSTEVTKRLGPTLSGITLKLQLVQAQRGEDGVGGVVDMISAGMAAGAGAGVRIGAGIGASRAQRLLGRNLPPRQLEPGEIGYRRTMATILRRFQENSTAKTLFIADDDVRFHVRFRELYEGLDSYCFNGLASGYGVLKLSTSIWHDGHFPRMHMHDRYIGGWHLIDYEMSRTNSKCYSGHYAAVGSVATVYSRGVVPWILAWLNEEPNRPFDHVFGHLAQLGAPIRVAEPNLCIADLNKTSSVHGGRTDTHAEDGYTKHRWDRSKYLR
jgi:hypothetical protein